MQNVVDESEVWRDEYERSHRAREEHEPPEKSKKQRLQIEEEERLDLQRKREQEELRRREEERRAEELRLEEERRRMLQEEERLRREEEERRQWEEEKRKKEEEEKRRREAEQRLREEEERNRREEEERKKREEEARRRAEEERRKQELEAERLRLKEAEERRKKEEEAENRRLQELEEIRREEEERLREEQRRQEEEGERKRLAKEKKMKEQEDKKRQEEERAAEEQVKASDPEWKRKAEELRWREMEERQRPFTFKVSSGEKQILFQKVNLSPVTPVPGQQVDTTAETKEGTPGGADSPTLSSSLYVPHTAILVTGAQLCGTAVNLDQIKDSACKSLLGLSEDKKAMGTSPMKSKISSDRKSGKTKSLNEASLSVDQSSSDVLAEWASIRSKIFKGAEDGKYPEYPDHNRKQSQSRTASEDLNQPPFSHANLRKTMSASAKFSITPARKKFADSSRNSEVFSQDDREGGKVESLSTDSAPSQPLLSPSSSAKAQNKGGKTVRISDTAEECKFAKDLPSFLVPSPTHGSPKSQRSETVPSSQMKSEIVDSSDDGDQRDQSGDERPSPFGIKLRRTNYSLRFHSEQSTEKRKKRYSAGDSFEGVPAPLTSTDQDSDSSALSEKTSPTTPLQETDRLQAISNIESQSKTSRNTLPTVCNEPDKPVKPPLYQKPITSPRSSDGASPPPSPLPKSGRRTSGEMLSQRTAVSELPVAEECTDRKEDPSESVQIQKNGQGDDEPKEKKSFFPSISIPWREKTDRRTELIKRGW